ncbi:nicotinate (nicotinamide) nucleotide adenylyltransferase [Geofilum rubicundum]|uniref:Probable nicotinate-nucleotide adenylyltransferase n=1 Tax=Geofilum rubicundum JCM 15548 TaxID=1236989 RepID=A0A0E9LYU0_9BACT|nr:nicotinate (nicotinamide) nucleotide adenylyltransferase [Geofilum rubicundum]GAO30757.1 nicotinate-nucleotide adenylyltransferase [Geofilum rubicundum JCM 15548]
MKHVGLLFGSFNPVHIGHLALANYILEYEKPEEIWFVVTPLNPFKTSRDLLDEKVRLDILTRAIQLEPRFKASDFEFALPRPSYTIDTLDQLSSQHPDHHFSVIMGADNLLAIDKWKEAQRLLESHPLLVYPRPGFDLDQAQKHANIQIIQAPVFDLSSTMIREALQAGKNIRYLLPHGVYDYIRDNKLYPSV